MGRILQYLRMAGVPERDVPEVARGIESWDQLRAWMDRHQQPRIQPSPRRTPIRTPVLPLSWKENLFGKPAADDPRPAEPGWVPIVQFRQRVTFALAMVTTAGILLISHMILRAQQMPEFALYIYLLIYGIMTYFLAANFYKLALGTWHVVHARRNPWHPSHAARDPQPDVKVAIVFPVYHEEVARVAAGIAATWTSIERDHPRFAGHFDIFLLSDSRKVEYWVAEQAAIHRLSEMLPNGRFFYRRRPANQNAKLGNIVDFCRRWGAGYDYMLVMDADSVMDGDAVIDLLRMMEGNPRIGILQTNPKPILRSSLFGRMQQFAARLYGSVFSYSLQAMYMGHASYIGHNALIRMRPFIDHCILPELSGPIPWGGKPLSHDIVESAMMARAGYEVWFLPDIEGSYEEIPANLVGFLARERRWMQGNLQHIRLLLLRGIRSIHRETFLSGSMGYVAAPLWAAFLIVSAYGLLNFLHYGMLALDSLKTLQLPVMMLLTSSLIFLFLPRFLALLLHLSRNKARMFGGKRKLVWSVLLETFFSLFFSPLLMIYIVRFFWLWFKRRSVSWGVQDRGDTPLPWDVCIRNFGWISAIGFACLALMVVLVETVPYTQEVLLGAISGGLIRPADVVIWFFPIIGGAAGSIWIARYTSLTWPGINRSRIFCIPEEVRMPPVVQDVVRWHRYFAQAVPDADNAPAALRHAISDPHFYVHHRRETRLRPHIGHQLLPKIRAGARLTAREWLLALSERRCFDELHAASAGRFDQMAGRAA